MVRRSNSDSFPGLTLEVNDQEETQLVIDHPLVRRLTRSSSMPGSLREMDSVPEEEPPVSPFDADIRCDEAYGEFYKLRGGPKSPLPPPLQTSMEILEDVVRRNSTPDALRARNPKLEDSLSSTPTAKQTQMSTAYEDTSPSPIEDNSNGETHVNPQAFTNGTAGSPFPLLRRAPRPYSQFLAEIGGRAAENNHVMDEQRGQGGGKRYQRKHQIAEQKIADEKTFRGPVEQNGINHFPWKKGKPGPHFVKNQLSCRSAQKLLQNASATGAEQILNDLLPEFAELMTDPYGHFLCLKLMEICQGAQIDRMADAIIANKARFRTICLSWHGTRATQRLVEVMSMQSSKLQLNKLRNALKPLVVELATDRNGNHVIHKCLSVYSLDGGGDSHPFSIIFDVMGQNIVNVGNNRHGCCILQRCVQIGTAKQQLMLAKGICDHCIDLMKDPFGNYVVQCILFRDKETKSNKDDCTNIICDNIKGKTADLAKQKFASNAIEICIVCSDAKHRKNLISELFDDESELTSLLKSDYGNYVVQKCLDLVQEDELDAILSRFLSIFANAEEGNIRRVRQNMYRKYPQLLAEIENRTSSKESKGSNNKQRKHNRKNHGVWRTFSSNTQQNTVPAGGNNQNFSQW